MATNLSGDHGNESTGTHAQREVHSRQLLEAARQNASKEHDYRSEETREQLQNTFSRACEGKTPYDWQVDVAEALTLGLDVALTAGTGAGKTMPFVMPLFRDAGGKKMVLIVSPLNELERDQARRFKEMGLTAAAVNGEDYSSALHKEIIAKKFRVLVTSPEMCLKHVQFSTLMHSPEFMRDVMYVVIDEAHCVSQWGDSFRKDYSELVRMRSYLGLRKPFLLASATFPPFMLSDVFLKLEFRESTTYFVNIGNNRENIAPIVHRMKASQSSLPIIDFLVRDALPGSVLDRTIVFFNTRDLAFRAHRYLQDCVCPELQTQIGFLHAGRGQRARRRVMRQFREGTIRILCATEAAGMGMDIPNIDYIVQFLSPSSLSVWTQRLGRAGRSGAQAYVVLLIEPAVFEVKPQPKPPVCATGTKIPKQAKARPQKAKAPVAPKEPRKKRKSASGVDGHDGQGASAPAETIAVKLEVMEQAAEQEQVAIAPSEDSPEGAIPAPQVDTAAGDASASLTNPEARGGVNEPRIEAVAVEYKKQTEDGMRRWSGATACRRAVADEYFGNPPRPATTDRFPCCDNCVRAKLAAGKPLSPAERTLMALIARISSGGDVEPDEAEDAPGDSHQTEEDPVKEEEPENVVIPDGRPDAPTRRIFAIRRDQHLADCRARLYRWRMELWAEEYRHCSFSWLVLLPDTVLTRLATQGRLQTVSDIKKSVPHWAFADRHGASLLHVLSTIDLRYDIELKVKARMAAEARAKRTAENKIKREEDRRVKRRVGPKENQRPVKSEPTEQLGGLVPTSSPIVYTFTQAAVPGGSGGPSQSNSEYRRPVRFV